MTPLGGISPIGPVRVWRLSTMSPSESTHAFRQSTDSAACRHASDLMLSSSSLGGVDSQVEQARIVGGSVP